MSRGSCSSDEGIVSSCSNTAQTTAAAHTAGRSSNKLYKGVRCRKWGKWVSEIRVPGTHDRLWLGSYSTPEAAAVAHDIASYCFRGNASLHKLNFPASMLPSTARTDLSPRSIQKVASDAAMAVDARFALDARSSPPAAAAAAAAAEDGYNNNVGAFLGRNDSISSSSGGSGTTSSWQDLTVSVEDYYNL